MSKITFGSDPEFMLKNAEGELKSAIGIIKGSKEKRLKIGEHEAYYDNVLAECAIKPGANKEEVILNFRDCFKRLVAITSPLEMTILASGNYNNAELAHKEANEFGCDPDFCAYSLSVNGAPDVPQDGFRTAGGHIHVGFEGGVGEDIDTDWRRLWVVRMLDLFVGIPSLFLDNSKASVVRRGLYGRAGCHRRCVEYGVEYRSMSNFWLASPTLVELVYDLSDFSVGLVLDQKQETLWEKKYDPDLIFKTINSGDTKTATKVFMPILNDTLPKELMERVIFEIEKKEPYNFYNSWELQQ